MSWDIPPNLLRLLPPEDELEERFITAGGPGGQHVNKTATAVQLRFDANASPALSPAVKKRLVRLAGKRAGGDGVITIEARSHRSQYRNRIEARKRLAELIEKSLKTPRRRIPTRVPKSAKKKRLEQKRQAARIKSLRRPPDASE